MSLQKAMETIEASSLPSDTVEAAMDALGFTQALHDLFVDIGIVNSNEVDVAVLEKSFESFLGENLAAAIFLSTFSNVEEMLQQAHDNLQGNSTVPSIVSTGYKNLAERVAKTRQRLADLPEAE